MIYTLSIDSFNSTFAVKPDGSKLTHHSGNRFKLFPFIANNNSEPVRDLKVLVGRYLSQIEGREPLAFTADELKWLFLKAIQKGLPTGFSIQPLHEPSKS